MAGTYGSARSTPGTTLNLFGAPAEEQEQLQLSLTSARPQSQSSYGPMVQSSSQWQQGSHWYQPGSGSRTVHPALIQHLKCGSCQEPIGAYKFVSCQQCGSTVHWDCVMPSGNQGQGMICKACLQLQLDQMMQQQQRQGLTVNNKQIFYAWVHTRNLICF